MVVSFVVTSCCLCMLFFVWNVDHRDLPLLTPSFPTRRSSELAGTPDMPADPGDEAGLADWLAAARATAARALVADSRSRSALYQARSEEPTSELRSLMRNSYAVSGLKKNKNLRRNYDTIMCSPHLPRCTVHLTSTPLPR